MKVGEAGSVPHVSHTLGTNGHPRAPSHKKRQGRLRSNQAVLAYFKSQVASHVPPSIGQSKSHGQAQSHGAGTYAPPSTGEEMYFSHGGAMRGSRYLLNHLIY